MQRRTWLGVVLLAGVVLSASPALAQPQPPFFGGGVIAYDPEPAVVRSGVLLDAQAVVSHDRKYVTLNMRADHTRLLSLTRFPVVTSESLGFVGGADFGTGGGAGVRPNSIRPNSKDSPNHGSPAGQVPSPDRIERSAKSWILTRQGTYLLAPLK
ncbi:hypothetical protein [Fontivita pretiosa]|uniref:hypothetical protein n=1 Tax=Fontivita pretiosa TaxID=2989684 RepID=UPI003D172F66